MRSRRIVWSLFACLAALWTAPRVRAQAEIDELRAQVEAVRQNRPEGVPEGVLTSLDYSLDVATRIERQFEPASIQWRRRVERYLAAVREGRDPYLSETNRVTNRGYRSPISSVLQGYGIYLPPDYDPERAYPLLIMLHGGSSNGNLFLGVVLGNNMDWLTYDQHLWDEYTPRWSPDWIVVAPDGFGQVLWRWMGEADVLAVIDDVRRHYRVDDDRIVLGGLSNGGLGTYAMGMRNAWRFSIVQAIAGAPSWLQYAGGRPTSEERNAMLAWSGMHLVENSVNTTFRFYHGLRDPGPMRPAFVREMEEHMRGLGLEPHVTWYDFGHDLLYLVHRHGRVYPEMAQVRRNRHPSEVRVVTGDYRANRQHWVTVSRLENYPVLARVVATASEGAIDVTTSNTLELSLDLRDAPLGASETLRVTVDGEEVYRGARAAAGHVLRIARDGAWRVGALPAVDGLEKVPGLSGPLTDPYRDGMIHVYGTQNPEQTEALRQAASRGARGWPLWLWNHQQPVVADTEVTPEMAARSHLVLYGTPGSNAVIERLRERLPIQVTSDAVVVGERRYASRDVGVRYVYPNPEAPQRYVIVQEATTVAGVGLGHNLPDFLPDWVVYDARTNRERQRLISGRDAQVAMGYFDRFWQLAGSATAFVAPVGDEAAFLAGPQLAALDLAGWNDDGTYEGGDDGADAPAAEGGRETLRAQRARILHQPESFRIPPPVLRQTPPIRLPITEPPPDPSAPTSFAAPADDPAGAVARRMAALIPTFLNFRGIVQGATWTVDGRATWQVRSERACLDAVRASGIDARPFVEPLPTEVPTPVEVSGVVDGVELRTVRPGERIVIACELAARLPVLARVLRAHHVRAVEVLSAYRPTPRQSFHTLGLALDLFAFETDAGERLSVLDDFVETPSAYTCEAPSPGAAHARELLRIACEFAATHAFSTVLTPNYNDGHRNHFHLDARPDDPRFYVR